MEIFKSLPNYSSLANSVYHELNYETKDSATLIDNIFSNNIESKLLSGLLISNITDHLPVFCCSKKTTSNNKFDNVTNVFERRLVNDTTLKTLNEKLYEKCDIILECKDDVNYAYSSFLDIFTKLYNQECPLIKINKCGNKNDKDRIGSVRNDRKNIY